MRCVLRAVVPVVLSSLVAAGCAGRRGTPPASPPAPEPDPSAAALGLRLAPGFTVGLYADGALANDIYSLAITPRGEIAVSSRGWIRILRDRDGDGVADDAEDLVQTESGSMGMLIEENQLFSSQDRGLWRVPLGSDGRVAGPPERLLTTDFGEHGPHIPRRGPDGWLYFLAGNEALPREAPTPGSPIREPLWGVLMRLSPDLGARQVVADGLRNPYRFDFTADGEALAYEANGERDIYLPWYQPTRLFHLAHGGHHGWTMPGWQRSFARPDDYPDTVPILRRMGEGSPTGVTCYRHTQFPPRYRGGIFLADWTWGRIAFLALRPDGGTYVPEAAEVFLESIGTEGFAPTDLAVAPDGALFVSIGGRGTRGAVYRIAWREGRADAPPADELAAVLRAPQPLEPWSRARWVPAARRLGAAPFVGRAGDEAAPVEERIRALEILTELFGGLPEDLAGRVATSKAPEVRARVAWSLGRTPRPSGAAALARLATDGDARVRVQALVALGDAHAGGPAGEVVLPNLAHPSHRVRHTAVWLASVLPEGPWRALADRARAAGPWEQIGLAIARAWRLPGGREHGFARAPEPERDAAVEAGLAALRAARDPAQRLGALRVLGLALGDWKLTAAPQEVYVPYVPSVAPSPARAARILADTVRLFPSGDARVDEELGRLFAMLEAPDPALPARVAARWTSASDPVADVHYLTVLSRLRGARPPDVTARAADALLALQGKLGGQAHALQNWDVRVAEVIKELLARDARLGPAIAGHPGLLGGRQLAMALSLEARDRVTVARRLLPLLAPKGPLAWNDTVVALLGELPPAESRPLLRAQHDGAEGLRDAILLVLARRPEEADRARLLAGLASFQPSTVAACAEALERLGPGGGLEAQVSLLRLLRRLTSEPAEKALRARVRALFEREAGRRFSVVEGGGAREHLQQAYRPLFDFFAERHPEQARRLGDDGEEDPAAFEARLREVPWDRGDPKRGEAIVQARACVACHTGVRSLGPSLAGTASRMSREDLFAAIAFPNRDVSPAYRPLVVQTRGGEIYTGTVVYESHEVLILRTGPTTTVRLSGTDIAARRPGDTSLMPTGLLEGLTPEELAHMYSYLRTLN